MDPTAELSWVPKIDKDVPKKEQFTILYHPLDMRKEAKISDNQIKNIQKGRKSIYEYLVSQADISRMENSIIGWKNFDYPDGGEESGKPVPFSLENIAMIPPEIRREYVTFITGREREANEEDDELGEATPA
jgi:hypothetical protein